MNFTKHSRRGRHLVQNLVVGVCNTRGLKELIGRRDTGLRFDGLAVKPIQTNGHHYGIESALKFYAAYQTVIEESWTDEMQLILHNLILEQSC